VILFLGGGISQHPHEQRHQNRHRRRKHHSGSEAVQRSGGISGPADACDADIHCRSLCHAGALQISDPLSNDWNCQQRENDPDEIGQETICAGNLQTIGNHNVWSERVPAECTDDSQNLFQRKAQKYSAEPNRNKGPGRRNEWEDEDPNGGILDRGACIA